MPAYRGLVVDLDGVVWRGDEAVPGAGTALRRLHRAGVQLVFVTNDPQYSRAHKAARLSSLGLAVAEEQILTANSAVASHLSSVLCTSRRLVCAVGSSALREELKRAGLSIAGPAETDVDAVVVAAHAALTYRELCDATTAVLAGAPLFAPGRDLLYPTRDGFAPATGAVVAAVEAATGARATVLGKPERAMFDLAMQRLHDHRPVAVIGDNVDSDIAGARRAGLDAILVLTGVSTRADAEAAAVRPDHTFDSLEDFAATVYRSTSERDRAQ